MPFAHEAGEDARVRTRTARVANELAVCTGHKVAITGDHDKGPAICHVGNGVRDAEHHHRAATLAVRRECLRREPFTRRGHQQILVVDSESLLKSGIEDGRRDRREARGVGICLCTHIAAGGTGALDEIQQERRSGSADTRDVDDVQ